MSSTKDIKKVYHKIHKKIEARLAEFKKLFQEGTEKDIFSELAFCILTPQSKAQSCWCCVEELNKKNLMFEGNWKNIVKELNRARFKNKKAQYIILAREKFMSGGKLNIKSKLKQFKNAHEAREWLVNGTRLVRSPSDVTSDGSPNTCLDETKARQVKSRLTFNGVKGMGYKEASHFLRNIGFGEELAILDRHILKNLKEFGVIDEIPSSISKKKYMEIESKMKEFSVSANIPIDHLDLVFWYKETGEIFK